MKNRFINLGCGKNLLPTPWKNYDAELDITKPLPFADNSVNRILIEHCLEHVSAPDGFRFMKEAHRVLEPGGVLRICVPELERMSLAEREALIVGHGHLVVFNSRLLFDLLTTAGFPEDLIFECERAEIDGHWKVIGKALDDRETLRVEATKHH